MVQLLHIIRASLVGEGHRDRREPNGTFTRRVRRLFLSSTMSALMLCGVPGQDWGWGADV
jgi:hypothetical protein